jgi:hypothetical protein
MKGSAGRNARKRPKSFTLDADELITVLEETADHVAGRRKVAMRTTRIAVPVGAVHADKPAGKSVRRRKGR